MIRNFRKRFELYSFELLLFSLLMVLFNKMFFPDQVFYVKAVWPINMTLLGLGAFTVYRNRSNWQKAVFYTLFAGILITPFISIYIFSSANLALLSLSCYILFYIQLFAEVMRQVTRAREVNLSVILGSLCGYLLLIVIAIFSFLLLEYRMPGSFNHTEGMAVPDLYIHFSYFSMVTLSTIGYGDITPQSDSAKLLASFFGISGQFYMVALVGIIVSKYSSKASRSQQ